MRGGVGCGPLALLMGLASHCITSIEPVRLNHVQVLHTHNTYHQCPLPGMLALFNSPVGRIVEKILSKADNTELAPDALSYGHAPLMTQLTELNVRSVELDVYFDPNGGRYAHRAGPKLSKVLRIWRNNTGQVGGPELFIPGWKVMHIPDLDFQATCDSLQSCLEPVGKWSRDNPNHSPLFIAIEIKTWDPRRWVPSKELSVVNGFLLLTPEAPKRLVDTPAPDSVDLEYLEHEILAAFTRSQVYTPDQFKRGYATLRESIEKEGWPLLSDLRGKVVLRALGSGTYRRLYETLRPGGKGALLFQEDYIGNVAHVPGNNTVFASLDFSIIPSVNSAALVAANITWSRGASKSWTDSQWQVVVDLYRQGVQQVVSSGQIMLRANADLETGEARRNFRGFGAAAAAGGAHFVHTDYPNGWKSQCGFTSPYTVLLQQIASGSWNQTSMSSVNTTNWNGQSSNANLATVCNPITGTDMCTKWSEGAQPAADCICYSLS